MGRTFPLSSLGTTVCLMWCVIPLCVLLFSVSGHCNVSDVVCVLLSCVFPACLGQEPIPLCLWIVSFLHCVLTPHHHPCYSHHRVRARGGPAVWDRVPPSCSVSGTWGRADACPWVQESHGRVDAHHDDTHPVLSSSDTSIGVPGPSAGPEQDKNHHAIDGGPHSHRINARRCLAGHNGWDLILSRPMCMMSTMRWW